MENQTFLIVVLLIVTMFFACDKDENMSNKPYCYDHSEIENLNIYIVADSGFSEINHEVVGVQRWQSEFWIRVFDVEEEIALLKIDFLTEDSIYLYTQDGMIGFDTTISYTIDAYNRVISGNEFIGIYIDDGDVYYCGEARLISIKKGNPKNPNQGYVSDRCPEVWATQEDRVEELIATFDLQIGDTIGIADILWQFSQK